MVPAGPISNKLTALQEDSEVNLWHTTSFGFKVSFLTLAWHLIYLEFCFYDRTSVLPTLNLQVVNYRLKILFSEGWSLDPLCDSSCKRSSAALDFFSRGIEPDFGADVPPRPGHSRNSSTCSFDAAPEYPGSSEVDSSTKTPSWSNMLEASSTIPDYVSHRWGSESGSFMARLANYLHGQLFLS